MTSSLKRTDSIAKERLRLMLESDPMDGDSILMVQMKKEISNIVAKYYDVDSSGMEIQVIIKQKKKRA